MAKANEEIDEVSSSGGNAGTVMVGGMDNLVPGGKAQPEEVEIEIEEPKTKPKAKPDTDEREREEDARLAYDVQDDDEIEERGLSRRQRRNRQRKTVVADRDQEIAGLYHRVDALTNMIGQMGQSHVGLTINNIDTQLGAANQALTLADVEIKKAVAAGDLARYDELRALKDEAYSRVVQLARQRQGIQQEMAQGGRPRPVPNGNGAPPPQPNQIDQKTQDFTETFMDRFDFDPKATDERTLIIKAIDDAIAAEGYRSNTQQYWITLEKKLANRGIYPAGDDDDSDDDSPRPAPARRLNGGGRPPTSGGSANRRGTGNTFRLDPMARDYLDSEGLLELKGLSDEQKAKRSRLINEWREGARKMARGEL